MTRWRNTTPGHLLMKITREEALRGLVDFGPHEERCSARTRSVWIMWCSTV